MAAFKGGSTYTPNTDFKQRLAATLVQNMKPSSHRVQPFKPDETQSDSGSSLPSRHVSVASTKATRMNYNRLETQESHVPSFPKEHQRMKQPLAQQRLTNRDDGVENIIGAKQLKLPEKQNYIRTCETQTEFPRQSSDLSVPKKRLPGVLVLGRPPPKPQRPPSVEIYRFRRSLTFISDGDDGLNEDEEAWPMNYQSEIQPDVYDDIGALSEICSGLNMQHTGEEDDYVEVDDPVTRVSPLPQSNTDGDDNDDDNVYECADYDGIEEDCTYEMD